ncbi:type I restriction enzyme M protein [Kordia periserrulae]|uniref:site-specific DNA-methyltransferase (adenine-specific) n=1 Tax=Kordia periserrulae TaxID=701523 RepID=A0A2T6C448_9FLAO|nr:type I restriction-modification system subunit M [Kordia periserrulae]PTX63084.1 type I restriction enzyme M protein [Kordia periserrulae]
MTAAALKDLEDKLWESANNLRANSGLKSSEYATPVLGLIFLKYADNKYKQVEDEIEAALEAQKTSRNKKQAHEIAIDKCGFHLPDTARFDYLLNLPEKESMASAIKAAMEGIERTQEEKNKNILPKDEYASIEKSDRKILPELLKALSDIPEDAEGDVFGKIYEYFLGKFALSEGQKGGQFFTPTSVVKFIVEVIEPYHGTVYDPACGSGGMFVQSAEFIRKRTDKDASDAIYVSGQEKTGDTVKLAKMNLMVNGLRGDIKQANSYADDPYDSYGAFDFVMANPPFNVKSVKESTVKNDKRFTAFGLPKNKGKKEDKITDANYLWVSLFATSLNDTGRAGFVMANSASDARNSEYDIRKQVVDAGIVDVMVTMPSNMFYTVTLPATLWFFDKAKVNTDRKDKILFIDARNVYKQLTRAHREWTEEHVRNLGMITRLYRGQNDRFINLVNEYLQKAQPLVMESEKSLENYILQLQYQTEYLEKYITEATPQHTKAQLKKKETFAWTSKWKALQQTAIAFPDTFPYAGDIQKKITTVVEATQTQTVAEANTAQQQLASELQNLVESHQAHQKVLANYVKQLEALLVFAEKQLKLKKKNVWNSCFAKAPKKVLEVAQKEYRKPFDELAYYYESMAWLHQRFPKAEYQDVVGLCKLADQQEIVDEQDYSLNPGRYVGVEIEEDHLTEEEFSEKMKTFNKELQALNKHSNTLETEINSAISKLF